MDHLLRNYTEGMKSNHQNPHCVVTHEGLDLYCQNDFENIVNIQVIENAFD